MYLLLFSNSKEKAYVAYCWEPQFWRDFCCNPCDEIVCLRVGAQGLEILDRSNGDKKESQTGYHKEGYLTNIEFTHVDFPYTFMPQDKMGKKAKVHENNLH